MRRGAAFVLAVFLSTVRVAVAAEAQVPPSHVPDLFDPNLRLQKPDVASLKSIRFLTTDDFPPFHFALADGTLAGFDIDLTRAICSDLKIACTIQARRFDTLASAIKSGEADAAIAAIANTPATREQLGFTAPYYTTPGRFVGKAASPLMGEATPERFAGHTIGVESGTAHEAFLKAFFSGSRITAYKSQDDLRGALRNGTVEAIFGDGIALAMWLNMRDSCCVFLGGPFTESRFFGNGVSIAVAKDNAVLRQLLDYELAVVDRAGTYADLYLKYFPIGFY